MIRYGNIVFLFERVVAYFETDIKKLLGNHYIIFIKNKFLEIKNNSVRISFVGIFSIGNDVICILPKYMYDVDILDNNTVLTELGKKTYEIIKTYENSCSLSIDAENFYNETDGDNISEFLIAEFLLDDFSKNGLYVLKNQVISSEDNGNEPLWDRTFDSVYPIIRANTLLYSDIFYKYEQNVSDSIISKVHLWAVSHCFNKYGLFFDFDFDLENFELEDLGEVSYVLNILNNALFTTYGERETMLLKSLISLLNGEGKEINDICTFYGHNRFEQIWEKAISKVFSNQYDTYKNNISRPTWRSKQGAEFASPTIIPDCLRYIENESANLSYFFIIDAKYYLIKWDIESGEIKNIPGVSDIVKQYFYYFILNRKEIADTLKENCKFLNILIFPAVTKKGEDLITFLGDVKIDISVKAENILCFSIEPHTLFKMFCKNTKISDDEIVKYLNVALSN